MFHAPGFRRPWCEKRDVPIVSAPSAQCAQNAINGNMSSIGSSFMLRRVNLRLCSCAPKRLQTWVKVKWL